LERAVTSALTVSPSDRSVLKQPSRKRSVTGSAPPRFLILSGNGTCPLEADKSLSQPTLVRGTTRWHSNRPLRHQSAGDRQHESSPSLSAYRPLSQVSSHRRRPSSFPILSGVVACPLEADNALLRTTFGLRTRHFIRTVFAHAVLNRPLPRQSAGDRLGFLAPQFGAQGAAQRGLLVR
jgi:hypothetical protein